MSFEPGSIEFTFSAAGEQLIRRRMEGMIQRLDDFSPALERIAARFHEYMGEVFSSQGAATQSGPWTPLAKDYATWKQQHYPGAGILHLVGKLERSLTTKGAPGSLEQVTRDNLVVGTVVTTPRGSWNLGLIHQLGRRDGSIPARRIIDPTDAEINVWLGYVREHISWEHA